MRTPSHQAPALAVSATGVGKSVPDLTRARGVPGVLVPVTITGGAKGDAGRGGMGRAEAGADRENCGQRSGRLAIEPNIAGVDTLVSELMAMRVRVGLSGYERFEAWREGTHDDMVLAVALACQEMKPEEAGVLAPAGAVVLKGLASSSGGWVGASHRLLLYFAPADAISWTSAGAVSQ